jgi:CHASE3 domain sensor protein
MTRKLRVGFGALLLAGAITTFVVSAGVFRRDGDQCRVLYTRSIKAHDIVDAARNALSALNNAEIHEQDYVLTGETVYSEAYAQDIQDWGDEIGSLELVARNDPSTVLAQGLSRDGARTLAELATTLDAYNKGGRAAALERIGKSGGIVFLEHARMWTSKIIDVDGGALEMNIRALSSADIASMHHSVEGALLTLCFTLSGSLLVSWGMRR